MRLHARDPRQPTWSLCGAFGWTEFAEEGVEPTCGHCRKKLGLEQIDPLARLMNEIERRRNDPEFMARVRASVARHKPILDRLADE